MGRTNRKIETATVSPGGSMADVNRYLKAVGIGINPHVPSVNKIREALSFLGELPLMEIKNHCLLLKGAINWKHTDEEKELIDNLLETF